MRNNQTTEFTKTIAISAENYDFIEKTRGKKSKAGMLKWIIDQYAKQPHLADERKE